jgi:hypothetical protein
MHKHNKTTSKKRPGSTHGGKRHIEEITRKDLEAFALRNVIFRNACEIAKAVPAYILRLSLSGGLCDQIEDVIRKDPVAVSNIYKGISSGI